MLRLLDGLPGTAAAQRSKFGLQLMAVYGLRPKELLPHPTAHQSYQPFSVYLGQLGQ
jgi:hypothetical protein